MFGHWSQLIAVQAFCSGKANDRSGYVLEITLLGS